MKSKQTKTLTGSGSMTKTMNKTAMTVAALMSASVLMGCGHRSGSIDSGVVGLGVAAANSITTFPATSAQCSNGGTVYAIYFDSNNNGVLDGTDSVISTQAVCNGSNGTKGSSGLSTVVGLYRVSVSEGICASGSGLQVSTGFDSNLNSTLDASEIKQTQIVCDGTTGAAGTTGATGAAGTTGTTGAAGTTGATGSAGTAGSNGHSVVMSIIPASLASCPTGGSTLLMALDVNDSGLYSPLDPQQQSTTICNGLNGTNGTNGTNGVNAQAPAYSTVDAIMPCGNTVSNKEVLLRLSDGEILGSVSASASGANTRFSFMNDGSYVDTDGSGCNFSVATSADGTTRSISWMGQVQSTWPVSH